MLLLLKGAPLPLDLPDAAPLREARAQALEAGIGWWAITSLGVDEAIEDDADTLTIAVRAPLTFAGDVQALLDVVAQHVREQWQVVAVTEGPGPLKRLAELFRTFPTSHALSVQSMGVPEDWHTLDLWRG